MSGLLDTLVDIAVAPINLAGDLLGIGGGGKKQPPIPEAPILGPAHAPSGGGFKMPKFSLDLPPFPEIPEPPVPEVMPLPDDAALLAAARRRVAGRKGGRTSTILSGDPNTGLI